MRNEESGRIGALLNGQLTRRELLRRSAIAGVGVSAFSTLLAACDEADDDDEADSAGDEDAGGADDEDDAEPDDADEDDSGDSDDSDGEGDEADAEASEDGEDDRYGGTLEVAITGEPPTLDIHTSTAAIVGTVGWHIYEPLFTYDSDYQVIPELVDEYEVSDDGMLNTLRLRQGVLFHNGDELTTADVVATLERWSEVSGLGTDFLDTVEEIEEVDEYTLEFHMAEPLGAFPWMLARQGQGCAIYPASIVEGIEGGTLDEPIGTGPYRVVEHLPDRHILVERFEDYAAREGEPDGYGGRKMQYVDEIRFIPVPDESARISGLQAGDYHYLENVSADQYEALEGDDGVVAEILPPDFWVSYVLNWESPIMQDPLIRQAVQAAIDPGPALQSGYGEFYRLDPSIMFQETAWHSTAGEELYAQADTERAAELLEEAGYDGTAIRWMTTQEYAHHYNNTVVGVQQLEDAGFNIDLQTYDWATVIERRDDPEAWDIFTTRMGFSPDPTQAPFMQLCQWPGWWCSEESEELLRQLQRETEFEDRYAAFEALQQKFYEEVPIVKVGDTQLLNARSTSVGGFEPQVQLGVMLWNLWIEDD